MTFDTFKETIVSALSNYYGSDYTLSIQKIPKNNQIILDGLTIQKKGQNISPTIYLNPYFSKFQDGMPMFHILEEIKNTYAMHHPDENIDIRFFTDYENAKDRICMKLIHYEKNRELLKEVPHIRFLDLAVVFYYLIYLTPGEQATILIYNRLCLTGMSRPIPCLSLQKSTPQSCSLTISMIFFPSCRMFPTCLNLAKTSSTHSMF